MLRRRFQPLFLLVLAWAAQAPLAQAAVEYPLGRTASGETFAIHSWTSEDGLPQNTVNYLAQTPDGYLWVGTRTGLARFDGVRFTVFTQELQMDDNDGSDLSCQNLEVDGTGTLWIRLSGRLISYRAGRFEKYSTKTGPLQCEIRTMTGCRQGGLWIAPAGGGLKRFEHGRFTRTARIADGLASAWFGPLREDEQDRVWIGCADAPVIRYWQRFDPASGELVAVSNVVGRAVGLGANIVPDSRGRLWLGVPGDLICWSDARLSHFNLGAIGETNAVAALKEDRFGAVWLTFGSSTKLVRLKDRHMDVFNLAEVLCDRDIRDLLPDREGNIWIGTGADGLLRIRPHRMTTLCAMNRSGDRQEIHSVTPAADGGVWLATGAEILRWQSNQVQALPAPLPWSSQIRSVFEDGSGQLWMSSREGLYAYVHGHFTPLPGAGGDEIDWTRTTFYEDRAGRLWIGSSSHGLLVWRGSKDSVRYTRQDGLSDAHVIGIRDGPDGSLWVGTEAGGLNQFRDGRFQAYTIREGLLANHVTPLIVEADGTLWLSTPRGLNRFRNGVICAVTEREGLFDNGIYSLLDDGRGNYWAHCNRGIFRMRQGDLHAVADGRQRRLSCVAYGMADGMLSPEGNGDSQPNAGRTPDGRLWFPTIRGVVVLDPGALIESDVNPPVLIEEMLADGEPVWKDGVAVTSAICAVHKSELMLPPGRGRVLEIRYTANSLSDPDKVRFQYRLVGVDRDWRDAKSRRFIHYNLRPGAYRFEVKAATHHDVWSETPAVLAFALAPYFWQRRWFQIAGILGVIGAAAGVQARRLKWQRRLLNLQHQHALTQERTRIARDLHDELGARLTALAMRAELAGRHDQRLDNNNGQSLTALADESRALAERMRDVIWAADPECDSLEALAARLSGHAEEFLGAAGIRLRLELPEVLPALALSADARHQLTMVAKEALHNVVKHARASEVRLGVDLGPRELRLWVSDNGTGIDKARRDGRGLSNMQRRIEALGGVFQIDSDTGGTTVEARVPMTNLQQPSSAP